MRWIGVTLLVSALAACGLPGEPRPFQDVGAGATSLRDGFNAASDRTRVVMLVSPTCGTCLHGAQTVQADVLDALPRETLGVFVVWLPKRGGQRTDVPEATKTVPDSRAKHYWDGDGLLMKQYDDLLELGGAAWDVYMVYPAGARWSDGAPPKPVYWAHQLGSESNPAVPGPWLSGSKFLRATRDAAKAPAHR